MQRPKSHQSEPEEAEDNELKIRSPSRRRNQWRGLDNHPWSVETTPGRPNLTSFPMKPNLTTLRRRRRNQKIKTWTVVVYSAEQHRRIHPCSSSLHTRAPSSILCMVVIWLRNTWAQVPKRNINKNLTLDLTRPKLHMPYTACRSASPKRGHDEENLFHVVDDTITSPLQGRPIDCALAKARRTQTPRPIFKPWFPPPHWGWPWLDVHETQTLSKQDKTHINIALGVALTLINEANQNSHHHPWID